MSKILGKTSAMLTRNHALLLSLAAAGMLAGCVATVRVPAPPPPPPPPPPPRVYYPPPPAVEVATPAVTLEVQATEPPPPLPEYEQPVCPEVGWMWTPGYWAFSSGGYYWVPGTWVAPPAVGVLWTPGYWGFVGGVYAFHAGYWGPHIGFYGGVNYGFGYGGVGFGGGRWVGGAFQYNTAVVHVNTTVIHNTYIDRTVINNVTVNRVSYNGGAGGVTRQPTPQERTAMAETHTPPTVAQSAHVQETLRNPQLSAKQNGGHPAIAATARPAAFSGPGVIGAHGAPPLKPVTPPAHGTAPAAAHEEARPNTPPAAQSHPQTAPPRPQVNNAAHPPVAKPAAKAPPKPAAKKAPEKRENEK